MILGFTGTRDGMTQRQKDWVVRLFEMYKPVGVVHGMCIGADAQFHELALAYKKEYYPQLRIVGRPCTIKRDQMQIRYADFQTVHGEMPPLIRNQEIVDSCTKLIACPKLMVEEIRSGTWATIRYARRSVKHLLLIWPQDPKKDGGGPTISC